MRRNCTKRHIVQWTNNSLFSVEAWGILSLLAEIYSFPVGIIGDNRKFRPDRDSLQHNVAYCCTLTI